MLTAYFADMHIHIGRDIQHRPVKITASKNLTLTNILIEASRNKGIDLIGIIDSQVPSVQEELMELIRSGEAMELQDGGIRYKNVTLLLGCEMEVFDAYCQGPIHVLAYFPTIEHLKRFTNWLKTKMKNISLSSQRYYGTAKALQYKVKQLDGIFIPAHIFTPFKSLYGKGVKQFLHEVFDPKMIDAVELGLSCDTTMAEQIVELDPFVFLSNSDAHSLNKIAREYQTIKLKYPSFEEFYRALNRLDRREITANYGMNPKLGKYYTTVCSDCLRPISSQEPFCEACGSTKIIKGVAHRIQALSTRRKQAKSTRPPYYYQVPLEYIPTLGPKTLHQLLQHFGTEMNVIHNVPFTDLKHVVSDKIAHAIIQMREGKQVIDPGGGGIYGKVIYNP